MKENNMKTYTVSCGEATVQVESSSPEAAFGAASERLKEILAAHLSLEDCPSDVTVTDDDSGREFGFAPGWK